MYFIQGGFGSSMTTLEFVVKHITCTNPKEKVAQLVWVGRKLYIASRRGCKILRWLLFITVTTITSAPLDTMIHQTRLWMHTGLQSHSVQIIRNNFKPHPSKLQCLFWTVGIAVLSLFLSVFLVCKLSCLDFYRSQLHEGEVETWILIGDTSCKHPSIHCKR